MNRSNDIETFIKRITIVFDGDSFSYFSIEITSAKTVSLVADERENEKNHYRTPTMFK